MPDQPTFYVTTPIYYVNARPHIGHAYTTVVADVVARRHRLLGERTWFLTGTDEHGQKIERSAAAAGIPPQQFADSVSKSFRDLWARMGITNDDFIRTTDPRHKAGAQKLFRELYNRGEIYLSSYTGEYCVSEEMFVEGPPGTIGPDGRPTETVTEENFFFRLSNYQRTLLELIEAGTLLIQPESRRNEVFSFVQGNLIQEPSDRPHLSKQQAEGTLVTNEGMMKLHIHAAYEEGKLGRTKGGNYYLPGALKDLSVSRSSFTWGIPVPEPAASAAKDPHVIYVWLDALANYMTALGYGSDDPADQACFAELWPADLHLVGKEIIRFHCVYWPAFLLALNPQMQHAPDEPAPQLSLADQAEWIRTMLPKSVVAHGWLLFEESKMSKSRGNIVRTETILDGFGDHYRRELTRLGQPEPTKADADLFASDVLRYFLLREIPFGQDGSFSFDAMITRYNADLANGYGNLVSRVLAMIERNCGGKIPNFKVRENKGIAITGQTPPEKQIGKVERLVVLPDLHVARIATVVDHFYQSAFAAMRFSMTVDFEQLQADLAASRNISPLDRGVLDYTALLIDQTDRFISEQQPWKLAKSSDELHQIDLQDVLYTAAESIRILTALLYPILPYSTAKVWAQLGLGDIEQAARDGKLTNLQWGGLQPGTKLGPLAPIFPRAPKELAQIMSDMETKPSLTAVTADNDAATSERSQFIEAPISDLAPANSNIPGAPSMAQSPRDLGGSVAPQTATPQAATDPAASSPLQPASTSPAAPPSTSTLPHENPGSQVGASSAPAAVLPSTPSHAEAAPSGVFAGATAATPITTTPSTTNPQITIDDFVKVELRVARILVAERIPKADKLLRLEVDLGPELGQRQILSGIAEWYPPETLVGRTIVVITNLAPRKMRGLESHGMLLAASTTDTGKPILATFGEDIAPGTRLK